MPEIVTVMDYAGIKKPSTKDVKYHRPNISQIVIKFYASIKKQRMAAVSWETIAELLGQAGQRINHNSLRIQFHKEHERRHDKSPLVVRHVKKAKG
jgi:hypothetical protein